MPAETTPSLDDRIAAAYTTTTFPDDPETEAVEAERGLRALYALRGEIDPDPTSRAGLRTREAWCHSVSRAARAHPCSDVADSRRADDLGRALLDDRISLEDVLQQWHRDNPLPDQSPNAVACARRAIRAWHRGDRGALRQAAEEAGVTPGETPRSTYVKVLRATVLPRLYTLRPGPAQWADVDPRYRVEIGDKNKGYVLSLAREAAEDDSPCTMAEEIETLEAKARRLGEAGSSSALAIDFDTLDQTGRSEILRLRRMAQSRKRDLDSQAWMLPYRRAEELFEPLLSEEDRAEADSAFQKSRDTAFEEAASRIRSVLSEVYNNHAVEHAHATTRYAALAAVLEEVVWTRGSGGEVVGNDEYASEDMSPGGGGNYVTARYGPLGGEPAGQSRVQIARKREADRWRDAELRRRTALYYGF